MLISNVHSSSDGSSAGIQLFNNSEALLTYVKSFAPTITDISDTLVGSFIVQKYVEKPLLIDQKKFDIRLFVLVPSLNPLVIFANKDFYLRFTTVPFSLENIQDRFVAKCVLLCSCSVLISSHERQVYPSL